MQHALDSRAIRLVAEIPVGDRLGEAILWDDAGQCFMWIDIEGRRFHRLSWPGLDLETFTTPFRIGSFALTNDPNLVVAAFESGFATFHYRSGRHDWIARPNLPAGVRFNDGRVDREGRFVAGTLVEDSHAAGNSNAGQLFRLNCDGSTDVLLDGLAIPNALCWSPDGATAYHTDTLSFEIASFDYSERMTGRRCFAQLPRGQGPDGATVDAEGRIWVALWGGSKVAVFSDDGCPVGEVSLPVTQPTCPAFGGANRDVLAVTSASAGLSEDELCREPGAGNLFLYSVPAAGLPEPRLTLG